MPFELSSQFKPRGDQQRAIDQLFRSLEAGNRHQTLLGVTGSGKTFTAANVLAALNKPTLVISHNKTLAAQLYSEFKQFFPNNAVEYFVSYFDYYQPEAYIPRTDTYIEKDSSINEEIERLRLSATSSLLSRDDVIVVASVSCIYGLGSPEDYANMVCVVAKGQQISRELLLAKLVDMLYERNDVALTRGRFRARGDVVEVYPATFDEEAIRVEFFGDEIDDRVKWFEAHAKFLEAQRIKMRTEFDLEMMQEMGFCSGIENYSRHLSGRPPGSRPYTLLDFFPKDFLLIVDESHATIPQIGGMYEGDYSRKTVLVEYGFRLPSALDNRPLNFQEFMEMTKQILYISATPAEFEIQNSVVGNTNYIPHSRARIGKEETEPILVPMLTGRSAAAFDVRTPGSRLIAQQIIRPTGLLDPKITVRPLKHQIDETIELCRQRTENSERVLITTLTKRTAEDLTDYLREVGLKVRYLHSEIDAIERVEILRSLRAGEFDILIGINLLREGLDLPEVSMVCILDADKEGFLRSQTSLIQTAGRAARHVNGEVILFADTYTESIQKLIAITEYRRTKQIEYNEANDITPTSVRRAVQESLHTLLKGRELAESVIREGGGDFNITEVLRELEEEMQVAAASLEYERAALLRDQIMELKNGSGISKIEPKRRPVKYGIEKPRRSSKAKKRSA
jgi:excinuclease ABC subunit B